MYTVSKEEFNKLKRKHPDYISKALFSHEHDGKICDRGDWCCFEILLSGDPRHCTRLIFEHIHFEIV